MLYLVTAPGWRPGVSQLKRICTKLTRFPLKCLGEEGLNSEKFSVEKCCQCFSSKKILNWADDQDYFFLFI